MAAKKTIFTLGIAIVTLIVFAYGIATFYPRDSSCFPTKFIGTESECTQEGGEWTEDGFARPVIPSGEITGFCDFREKCDPIKDTRDRNVAIISFLVGGALLIYGIKGKKLVDQTTAGFVGGGLLIVGYGLIAYWVHLEDTIRFIVVLGILLAMVWIGNKYKDYFK